MFLDSICQILHLKVEKSWKIAKEGGILISEILNLHIYTIKTPLIGRISIKTVFSWSQKRPI